MTKAVKPPLFSLFALIPLTLLCCGLVGCWVVTSRADVIGQYDLSVGSDRISLTLSPDGTFIENVLWASGKVDSLTGTWRWGNGGDLSFDKLWIPKAFAPDYIIQADSRQTSDGPKYTEPGYWSVSAERHWGKVTIAVFPGADVEFKMVHAGN
jgi:hypothetical protein